MRAAGDVCRKASDTSSLLVLDLMSDAPLMGQFGCAGRVLSRRVATVRAARSGLAPIDFFVEYGLRAGGGR